MESNTIIMILSIIIFIGIIFFIIKKFIKVAIILGIIFILFNIGFRYNGNDIKDNFKVNEYLNSEASNKTINFFNDFDNKRKQYGVINEDKVYDKMKNTANTGEKIFIEGLGKVNIWDFSQQLAENIYNAGIKEIDFGELHKELKKELNISDEDAKKITKNVEEILQILNTSTSSSIVSSSK